MLIKAFSIPIKLKIDGSNQATLLLIISIISALSLAMPCAAQSGYEIRNAAVTPEYGYEDFTYTTQVWMSEDAAREVGLIAVTKYSMKLNIYDQNELIYSESSPTQTGMGKTSFSFGPYSFKDRFAIQSTSNATFEFIFYAGGQQVAKTARIKGPIVQPPTMTGTPSFEKKPYFFQGIALSAGFKDLEGLNPKPTCHLEITGPLGTADSRSWTTADVSCQSSGKSSYSCTVSEDLSSYRTGGDFSFKLVYNNLKVDPLTYGPYNISLQPYNPSVEKVSIPKTLDYTNFSIQAFVKDAGAKMIGGIPDGSKASLIISHPRSGDKNFESSDARMVGSFMVYDWTNNNIPALFNRSDVQMSKVAPFQAKVVYRNDNWDYQADKSNISFKVIEEIPKLDLQYPTTVYVREGEVATQDISATVSFSKGAGDMNLHLSGPDLDLNQTEKGTPMGGNKYQYKWQVAFDDRHINNNYTMALSFIQESLEGGLYAFEDKTIKVLPLSVHFSGGVVSPSTGQWNGSYTYSQKIDTTVVPLEVRLQTYDPCSSEWTDKGAMKATVQSSWQNWTLSPFSYECTEMQQQSAKFRFKASFAGKDYYSKPYQGPSFEGGSPVLISLESDPVVYVSEGSDSSASVAAVVEYSAGQGQAILSLPEKSIDEASKGIAVGSNRYRYEWSLPFDATDSGKSFNYTITYRHPSLDRDMQLAEDTISVKSLSIDFGKASVTPAKGKWNDTFVYSVPVSSSIDAAVKLEVYNPCTHTWVQRATRKVSAGDSVLDMKAQPLKSKCADLEGNAASFRYSASFAGQTSESEVYSGPTISGGQPRLISFDIDEPALYVTKDSPAYQSVKAVVDFPGEQDTMQLTITGPNKTPVTEEMNSVYLGATQYLYTWNKEFGLADVGNYTISVKNTNPSGAGGAVTSAGTMMVAAQEASSELEPKAIGDVKYLPVLFVSSEKGASQTFSAEVFSPGGKGTMTLDLTGADKSREVDMAVTDLGANRYGYDYTEEFDASNAGNNYMFSLEYLLNDRRYSMFDDHIMQVALEGTEPEPIWEPKLILEYDTTLYVPAGGRADQLIHATINYSESGGILKLNLTGPSKNFSEDLSDRAIGDDKYLYEAAIPFEDKDIGNSFKITLAFNHTGLGDYRFADHYMRVLKKAPTGVSQETEAGAKTSGVFNERDVTVIGNVTPEIGVIQAWDEKDPIYSLTYSLELLNWSSQQVPWVELSVRPNGTDQPWMIVGGKKRLNPATRSVSWTLKPFWETPFLGQAEYRFLINGAETQTFEGPEIIAVVSNAGDRLNNKNHDFWATVNSNENLTICLLGGDNAIPELIKTWTTKGQCQDYLVGSGEQTFRWQIPEAQTSPYYDFDIRKKSGELAQ
ncbi:MAG: hypothetical protein A4E49_01480 [Methanosaeta sp. PtaU1.Bin112]|nr:MAG: hypothetical protein A4E49_01480 [Methanosaeta sp. PtaU1.Bin112]